METRRDQVARVLAALEGGYVERAHTIPHIGSYTVGHHSFGVALLAILLHPNPSAVLLRHAIRHDLHERWTGDIPPLPKALAWDLQDSVKKIKDLGGEFFGVAETLTLNSEELKWLKSLDRLECLMWCEHQMALGNTHVSGAKREINNWFEAKRGDGMVPDRILEFLEDYRLAGWFRTAVDRKI